MKSIIGGIILLLICHIAGTLATSNELLDELREILIHLREKENTTPEPLTTQPAVQTTAIQPNIVNDIDQETIGSSYIDFPGRRCARQCRFSHKDCYGRNPNDLKKCTAKYMHCFPTCFFTRIADDIAVDAMRCTEACVKRYDQCVFFSDRAELVMCLRSRHVCTGGCPGGGVVAKRGCHETCAAEYMVCEHVIQFVTDMLICHQNHAQCRSLC